MSEQDLMEIESALAVRLPDEYRRVMTSDDAPPADEFFFGGLFNQPDTVIERTKWSSDLMADYKLPWSKAWVVVSEVNGGDPVILDTAGSDAPLLLWDHETNVVEPFPTTVTQMAT